MTLPEITEMFSTDEKCRELLERLRWPNGPECPRCHTQKIVRLVTSDKLLYCAECDYQFTVTSGTIFHDSHLPLATWFMAVLLLAEARKGISANQIKRTVGMSYKTAWYLCHRIRAAMKEADQPMLDGTVEMDETYVGGKLHGSQRKPGFGDNTKQIVIGIRQRDGDLRFFHATDVKQGTVAKYIRENISEDVDVLVTDEHPVYPYAIAEAGVAQGKHKRIQHKAKIYVQGEVHTNTVENAFSLLKRGIIGNFHQVSIKHLHRYLSEFEFRFNRREEKDRFEQTLKNMVNIGAMPYKQLITGV